MSTSLTQDLGMGSSVRLCLPVLEVLGRGPRKRLVSFGSPEAVGRDRGRVLTLTAEKRGVRGREGSGTTPSGNPFYYSKNIVKHHS